MFSHVKLDTVTPSPVNRWVSGIQVENLYGIRQFYTIL